MADYSGWGDTEEEAIQNLIKNMASTHRNIQDYKKYHILFKDNGVEFKNDIDIKQIDNEFHAITNFYSINISGLGSTKEESLKNLVQNIKSKCDYANYYYTHIINYCWGSSTKTQTMELFVGRKRGTSRWVAALYK
jgi:bifunctional N-acetylglucosamine-1-phosphate-uridyltransferase/glucosamine-1-phosphate-acetyltransferase GlmU-like protein